MTALLNLLPLAMLVAGFFALKAKRPNLLLLIAALALTGPASRLTEDRKTSGISQLMQETANRLSLKLGASKPFCETFYGVKE